MQELWRHTKDPLRELLEFLTSQPLLEDLKLDMEYLPTTTTYLVSVPVMLPQLKNMEITASQDYSLEMLQAIGSIIKLSRTPNLSSLCLGASIDEGYKWEGIFPCFDNCANLIKLEITNYIEMEGGLIKTFSPFELIFQCCHKLEHLIVRPMYMELFSGAFDPIADPPPLQRLTIIANSSFTSESLLNILQHLIPCGRLKQLDLSCCGHLLHKRG
jgi:hypothetical protein